MRIRDILLIDAPNGNGRIYPKEVMEQAIQDWKDSKVMMFGTLETQEESPSVRLSDVAFIVKDLIVNSGSLDAEIKILETPNGIKLQNIFNFQEDFDTTVCRIVPRALGNVENNVVSNLKLLSLDIVAN